MANSEIQLPPSSTTSNCQNFMATGTEWWHSNCLLVYVRRIIQQYCFWLRRWRLIRNYKSFCKN